MMMLVLLVGLVLVPVVKCRSGRSPRRSPRLFAMEKEQCQAPFLFSSAWDRWPGWSVNMISLFNFTSVGTKPELRLRQGSVWGTILALSQEAKEHSVMHAQSAFIATFWTCHGLWPGLSAGFAKDCPEKSGYQLLVSILQWPVSPTSLNHSGNKHTSWQKHVNQLQRPLQHWMRTSVTPAFHKQYRIHSNPVILRKSCWPANLSMAPLRQCGVVVPLDEAQSVHGARVAETPPWSNIMHEGSLIKLLLHHRLNCSACARISLWPCQLNLLFFPVFACHWHVR